MAKVNRKILIISKCMQYFHLMNNKRMLEMPNRSRSKEMLRPQVN